MHFIHALLFLLLSHPLQLLLLHLTVCKFSCLNSCAPTHLPMRGREWCSYNNNKNWRTQRSTNKIYAKAKETEKAQQWSLDGNSAKELRIFRWSLHFTIPQKQFHSIWKLWRRRTEFQQFQPESEEEEINQDSEEEEEVLEEELSEEEEEEEEDSKEDDNKEDEENLLDQAAAPSTPLQAQAERPFTPDSDNKEFLTLTAKTPNPRTPVRTIRPATLGQLLSGRLTLSQGASPAVSDFPPEQKTRKKKWFFCLDHFSWSGYCCSTLNFSWSLNLNMWYLKTLAKWPGPSLINMQISPWTSPWFSLNSNDMNRHWKL